MSRYVKDGHTVATSNAREGVRLKADGYVEKVPGARVERKSEPDKKADDK